MGASQTSGVTKKRKSLQGRNHWKYRALLIFAFLPIPNPKQLSLPHKHLFPRSQYQRHRILGFSRNSFAHSLALGLLFDRLEFGCASYNSSAVMVNAGGLMWNTGLANFPSANQTSPPQRWA
jgi:hypothetical protein